MYLSAKNNASLKNSCFKWLQQITKTNVFKRTILGTCMLSAFIALCKSNKLYIMIFTVLLTLGIVYELVSLTKKPNKPYPIKGIFISYIILIVYMMNALTSFVSVFPKLNQFIIIRRHRTILFYCYAIGIIICTLNLKKKHLSSQLLLLTIANSSAYVLGLACSYAILNISRGSFYYFYPCILVISNDIFAYIIGKMWGKTKLYELSPNKTIEGFLGASFFTWLVGMLLCYLKVYHNFLPDGLDIVIKEQFKPGVWYLSFPSMFIHNIMFSVFASFFAPFTGLLASAIKRSFNKKDFGALIPGHGGITDRMDCQSLMVFFTYFYIKSFLITRSETIERISNYIIRHFNNDEISLIIKNIVNN